MRYLAGPGHVGGVAVVRQVIAGSSAEESGLEEGDIVVACDGQALDHASPKESLLRAASVVPFQDIVLHVRRAPHSTLVQCVMKV